MKSDSGRGFAASRMGLGPGIQRLRRARCLKQREVVAGLNAMGIAMTCGAYSKIERNRMNIRASELAALKRLMNCSYGDFFVGLEEWFQQENHSGGEG